MRPLQVEPIKTPGGDGPLGDRYDHPAYGTISIAHCQGRNNLFGVDYPQQHYLRVEISTASLNRDLARDWVGPGDPIVSFYISEVQWARAIASVGQGSGVPCTLSRYHDPRTGKFVYVEMHPPQQTKTEQFAEEVKVKAQESAAHLEAALKLAAKGAKSGSAALSKSELQELHQELVRAQARLNDGLPWVVHQAEEALNAATHAAKGEIEAYHRYALQQLGKQALDVQELGNGVVRRVQLKGK